HSGSIGRKATINTNIVDCCNTDTWFNDTWLMRKAVSSGPMLIRARSCHRERASVSVSPAGAGTVRKVFRVPAHRALYCYPSDRSFDRKMSAVQRDEMSPANPGFIETAPPCLPFLVLHRNERCALSQNAEYFLLDSMSGKIDSVKILCCLNDLPVDS